MRYSAASAFALPLPDALRSALRARGVRRAAHIAAAFGKDLDPGADPGLAVLRGSLEKVLREAVPGNAELDTWVKALAAFLPHADQWEKEDVKRLVDVGPVLRDRALRERADAVAAQAAPTLADSQAELVWAPPPSKRWRTSRVLRRTTVGGGGPDARATAEREEHRRWSLEAVKVLLEVDAPVIRGTDGKQRDESLLANLFSARRASTLRSRVRVYRRFLGWLRLRPSGSLFYTSSDVIAFLLTLEDAEAGMSVPRSVVYAVAFMEKHGGWPEDSRTCRDPLVLGTAETLEQTLSSRTSARGEAIRYPVLVIISLELTVLDTKSLLVTRIVAGYMLLKIWACMRYDDTRAVDPEKVKDRGDYYMLPLARTKTSGSSGRIRQESFLLKEASLSGEAWAPTFLRLISTGEAGFARDYLLPLPAPGWGSVEPRIAEYADAAAMARSVLDGLRRPASIKRGGIRQWVLGPSVLLPFGLADCFTEHSGRKCLPSLSSTLPGIDREDIDALGNWTRKRSRGYDAMIGAVVARVQGTLTAARTAIAKHYHEHDLAEALCKFLVDRQGMVECDARNVVGPLVIDSMKEMFAADLPATSSSSTSFYYQAIPLPDDTREMEDEPEDTNGPEADYWMSVSSRTGYRRLHRRGGCWMKAALTLPVHSLTSATYNAKCGHCWKSDSAQKHRTELKKKIEDDTDTSVSTSSESSSSLD